MEPRPNSWDQTQHNLYRILEEDHMSLMDIPEHADPTSIQGILLLLARWKKQVRGVRHRSYAHVKKPSS
jgi:hypothetical protein